MVGLVSKKKYKKLKNQWQILREDYKRMRNDNAKESALKRYFVLKYLYPDIDPILMGEKETYQEVLEEINSIEEQKKMVLEKQKVEKQSNEKRN